MPSASRPLRVLLVEDSEEDTALILRALKSGGFDVSHQRVQTREAMTQALAKPWDVVLSDHSMPAFSALGAISALKQSGLDIPLLMLSGTINEEVAVDALRAGARDFVSKDRLARLCPAIERELHEAGLRAESRAVQEQLRQAQKLDAIGRLAGGIAHDFNNLLTVILTFSDLRLRELTEDDPTRADLVEIRKAGERAAALTRQLLAFSRQQVIELKPLNLSEVVSGMDTMFRRVIGEDIQFESRTPASLGIAKADVGQMEQVLMNLVINARDAMPRGGKLIIETANVELDEAYAKEHLGTRPGPHVMLAVSDTGMGMDRETQARIFEPFFTTKEKGKGTGLGLATVFGIVKQLGGSIWAYSEVGKGSTFKIYLPRTDEAGSLLDSTPGTGIQSGHGTLLLVEDELPVRAAAQRILTRAGFTVLAAEDPEDALRLAREHRGEIHLLISDVVMPGVSGPALSEKLKALRPAMRVLFMSGYTDEAVVRHGVLQSGSWFVQKPLTPETLTQKVREVLSNP